MRHSWYSWLEPFTNARRVFRPESANLRSRYQPLSDWRTGVGLACIFFFSLPGESTTVEVGVERLFNSYLSILASFVLVALVVGIHQWWFPTMPESSRRATRQVWIRLLVFIGAIVAYLPADLSNNGDLPTNPVLLVTGLWLAIYAFPMAWYSLRWTFGVGDVRPSLGPLVTSLAAGLTFTADALKVKAVQLPDTLPGPILPIAKGAALASVLVLAALEYRAIRKAAQSPEDPEPARSPPYRAPHRPYSSSAATAIALCLVMPPIGIIVAGWALLTIDSTSKRGKSHVAVAAALTTVLMVAICSGLGSGSEFG